MSHPIPEDAQRLADRLRILADEVESAARYGVPVPYMFSVSGHEYGGATFAATGAEFAAWVEYTSDEESARVDDDATWRSARVIVNGLPLEFSCRRTAEQVSA